MNTNFPSTRQWTIRIIPWGAILILVILSMPLIWLIITNAEARCGGFVAFLVVLGIAFVLEIVTCQLDLDRRMVTLERAQIWRKTRQEFSFDDVHTVSVQTSSDVDSTTYSVVFVLNSGDVIPLTQYSSSGKGGKDKMARNLIAYMNQVRVTGINAALDGQIRVEQEGETNGVPWKIAFVAGNDSLPQTRWRTSLSQLAGGFLLVMPAMGAKTGAMPGGVFGAAVRMIYGQYLRMLDVSETDLPGFANAQILPGDQVGLDKRFTILTNDPSTAKTWLTGERVRQLLAWTQSNPLKASSAAADPHLVVTAQGLRMTFRGKYNQAEQIAAIARLGVALSES
jgi:hypothetical protein